MLSKLPGPVTAKLCIFPKLEKAKKSNRLPISSRNILPIGGRASARENSRTFKARCSQLLTEYAFGKDDGRPAQLRLGENSGAMGKRADAPAGQQGAYFKAQSEQTRLIQAADHGAR